MAILSEKLGQRIKEIREGQEMKQVKLAEIIDMEPSNLSKLENGNQFPKEENIEKIAKALDVEIKELFEFGHLRSRKELLDTIVGILQSSEKKELEFIYKIITGLKVYQNQ